MKIVEVKTQDELDAALKSAQAHEQIIRLIGNGRFTVWESSHVEARESSHVVAWGSSHVVAWGSSHVVARGSSHVVASKFVAIHKQPSHNGKIKGGVVIKVQAPRSGSEWCDFYGVERKNGVAILFKAVRDDFNSSHGMCYAPGTTPSAPDWDGGKAECGGGLHFAFSTWAAKSFDSSATKFIACPVKVSEIVVHKNPSYPNKIKAPRVFKPCWEVDENGNKKESS